MNENLTVVRLFDDTIIWAKKSQVGNERFKIWDYKQVREGERPLYVDDEMAISNDAIRVFFRVIHGDKLKEKVRGASQKPDPTPAA
jgi:hypothetical protein